MWFYQSRVFVDVPEGVVGFVYIIKNLSNNKQYVGKKLFTKAGYKQVRGKRKKIRTPSDWMDYYGSNKVLQEDVKRLGPANFERRILHLCKTRGQCNYLEAKEQFMREVLEYPDQFYNEQVRVRVNRSHLKLEG